jgi:hypothetical protein
MTINIVMNTTRLTGKPYINLRIDAIFTEEFRNKILKND